MTDPENQLHAAGSPAKHGGFHHDKGCSNAFGDNPMRVLVPLLEFNHEVTIPMGFWLGQTPVSELDLGD